MAIPSSTSDWIKVSVAERERREDAMWATQAAWVVGQGFLGRACLEPTVPLRNKAWICFISTAFSLSSWQLYIRHGWLAYRSQKNLVDTYEASAVYNPSQPLIHLTPRYGSGKTLDTKGDNTTVQSSSPEKTAAKRQFENGFYQLPDDAEWQDHIIQYPRVFKSTNVWSFLMLCSAGVTARLSFNLFRSLWAPRWSKFLWGSSASTRKSSAAPNISDP